MDDITVDDLDEESFKIFRREALRSKRMTAEELNIPREELLQKLHLMKDGKLKRSAVLLFYDDPQVVQNGSYVKVGKFGKDGVLLYQHTNENLDELSLNIIKALKRDPRATQKMLAEQLNISVSSIQRIMAKLRKIGYIIRAGGKSDGYWIINYK